MKKYFIYLILLLGTISACKKNETEPVIGDVDERLSAALADYQKILTNAEFGWKGYLLTKTKIPATFLFNFTNNNRVVTAANYTDGSSESSYRLKALQRPTLMFDTYSILHLIADPTPTVFGGSTGTGYSSDFEYAFLSASADTIKLVGTLNKSQLILVRSKSANESNAVFTDIDNLIDAVSKMKTYFKRSNIGGVECEVRLDPAFQVFSASYLDESNNLKTVSSNFYVSGASVVLYDPVKIKNTTVSELKNLSYNTATGNIDGSIGSSSVQIREATAPLKLDVDAAQRWYTQMALNFNGCWVSDDAFHANGVDDFCNFGNIPGFQNLWYAGPAVFGGTSEGMITFTGSLITPYTLSRVPFTINAGIARFTLATNAGTFTGTSAVAQAMTAARQILYGGATVNSFQDWYLIPTSDNGKAYDMVRFGDATAWISWRPR